MHTSFGLCLWQGHAGAAEFPLGVDIVRNSMGIVWNSALGCSWCLPLCPVAKGGAVPVPQGRGQRFDAFQVEVDRERSVRKDNWLGAVWSFPPVSLCGEEGWSIDGAAGAAPAGRRGWG